jgi:hypothetical protein
MSKNLHYRDWRGYCVYSGKFLPDIAMNDEHVIPKSLGGYRSTVIRCSKELNSSFAASIDAPLAHDPFMMLARMRANAKGHSGRAVKPRMKSARALRDGEKIGEGDPRYTIEFQTSGTPSIWDQKAGKLLPADTLNHTGFVIDNWKIDHIVRAKFIVKTILGVGWKYLGPSLIDAIDAPALRSILIGNLQITKGFGNLPVAYSDIFLVNPDSDEFVHLNRIKNVLVRDGISTILIREADGSLEWSVSCVGEMVGVMLTPLKKPLLGGDVRPSGGIRLEITRDRMNPVLVDPFG